MKKLLLLIIPLLVMCGGCKHFYGDKQERPRLPEPPLTEEKDVYTADTAVTLDNLPIEALEIGGETMIALEDLTDYGFKDEHRYEGDALNMIAGYDYDFSGSDFMRDAGGELLGKTTPSRDIVRVNGVKIANDVFDERHYVSVEALGALNDPYNAEWGYSDYNMSLTLSGSEKQLHTFRFTLYDYGERLAEVEPLVDTTQMDIYTEGDVSLTPHYGGKYEPEAGIYAGIVGDGNGGAFKGDTPTFDHGFCVYSSYLEFDYMQDEIYYPNMQLIEQNDCVMLVPWNIEDITLVFDENYQPYIHRTLDNLKKFNRPIILRFAAEMNIGYLGCSPSAYVKAFRYIADIVHSYGFAVMWAPNDMCSLDRDYKYYYPGDEYVDWVGVSCFMRLDYLTQAPTSRSDAMIFNFGDYAYHTNSVGYITRFMEENGIDKPLAVSEGGVLSLADYDGAKEDFSVWAHERLGNMYWYLPMRYPHIKMITYFNHTSKGAPIGYWLKDKPDYIPIIDEALHSAPYLLSPSDKAGFTFVRADGREYSDDVIPIYTYLYVPGDGGHTVEYVLDDNSVGRYDEIPYKTILHTGEIPDGRHTLKVIADGSLVREYTVTKSGGTVSIK